MKMHKRIVSVVLALFLLFYGFPVPFAGYEGVIHAHAEDSTPAVDISYDDFSQTNGLQLNGDSLIANNAICFESNGNGGESVFTNDKIALGEDLSFSTAFSFKTLSPDPIAVDTKGGFTFTLQPAGNSVTAVDFHDENISPSLSVAFTAAYNKGGGTTLLMANTNDLYLTEKDGNLILGGLTEYTSAEEPPTRCEISVEPYIISDNYTSLSNWPITSYDTKNESSGLYHVWMGYDGSEHILRALFLTPSGDYTAFSTYIDLYETLSTNEVYAGFMGSLGDSGSIIQIGSWHFRKDLSLLDEAIADADEIWLYDQMEIYEAEPFDFNLPNFGNFGSSITWESDRPDIVAGDGTVTCPSPEEGNQTVVLTAIITKGSEVLTTREFILTVKVPDFVIVDEDYDWLTEPVIRGDNDSLDNVMSDLYLPIRGENGSDIAWSSSNELIVDWRGKVIRPGYYEGDTEVTLTAYIRKNYSEMWKTFTITVKALGMNDEEIIDADRLWLTYSQLLSGNPDPDNITGDINLPTSGQYESTISWESSEPEIINTDGTVKRPAFTEGDKSVDLIATISKGSSSISKLFTFTVKAAEPTDEEIIEIDKNWLTEAEILNGNTSLDYVVGDLELPTAGPMGSTISWESSDEPVVSIGGNVLRPAYADGDKIVTLKATLSIGSLTVTKEFTVKVIKLEQTYEEKLAADIAWLTPEIILNGNPSLDYVTGDLYLPTAGLMGSPIEWQSVFPDIVKTDGTVTRLPYTSGDRIVLVIALIGGSSPVRKDFYVTVKALDPTDEEAISLDAEWLKYDEILNGNTSSFNILGDLHLPTVAPLGSTIEWRSDNDSVVDEEGKVSRPAFTEGDKIVTLTAIIKKGDLTEVKVFTVMVISLEETDEEAVNSDLSWLIPHMEYLNGNLDNVRNNLTLPLEGRRGTAISWTSDNPEVLDDTGKVTRPTYTAGDKVVVLTATIAKGSVTAVMTITVTVKRLDQTAQEKVDADIELITDTLILNGNSSLDNITDDLNLPQLGENGSTINWISSDATMIASDGTVSRPSFLTGNKTVTLRAVASMQGVFAEKTFVLMVKALDISDRERALLDYEWLLRQNILGRNLSKNAVTENLSLPTTGPNSSVISWESNYPSIISNDGTVNRPENGMGHKAVRITAVVTKGDTRYTLVFDYAVLEKPDTAAPYVVETSLENNGSVPWDTDMITVTFNEAVGAGPAGTGGINYGIRLEGAKPVRIDVQIQGNMLVIKAYTELSTGVYRLVIPAGAFADEAGNPSEAYEMSFTVEKRPARTIRIVSTTPQDLAEHVIGSKMSVQFDTSDIQLSGTAGEIVLRGNDGQVLQTSAKLAGDTVNIELTGSQRLDFGMIYELYIPAGIVQDIYGNKNEEKTIRFRTFYGNEKPLVAGTNPSNGQTGVSVNQTWFEVTFTDAIRSDRHNMYLKDDKGNTYALSGAYYRSAAVVRLTPYTLRQLDPNTTYTLYGPYSTVDNPSELEFSVQFTTGDRRLLQPKTYPANGISYFPVNQAVEIDYITSVRKGLSFSDITFTDSRGNAVDYRLEETRTGIRLIPVSKLSSSTTYSVSIPEGAFQDDEGVINDAYKLTFTTARVLNISASDLSIPTRGAEGRILFFNAAEAEMIARREGFKINSYQWRINGELIDTKNYIYYTFKTAGNYQLELTIQDNQGNTYIIEETIEIQPLTNVRMSLESHDGTLSTIVVLKDGTILGLNRYDLKLMQDGQFIYGEVINVTLYKDGIQQRTAKLRTYYGDDFYSYTFTPQYGDIGTFELEFAYDGLNGRQSIRVPVKVFSEEPLYANEFTFRLNDIHGPLIGFIEEADFLDVTLNGREMRAYKKWYADKNCYAYAILNQNILANTYYEIEIRAWKNDKYSRVVYVGKDGSDPVVIYGQTIRPGTVATSINYTESTLKEPFIDTYFEGVSAKLVLNTEVDWSGYGDGGYYEIETEDRRFVTKIKSNGNRFEKITLDPGLLLKAGEIIWIRAVNKYGITSDWTRCPYINVVPQPSLMGKKLSISVQGGEYAMTWPTVFDGIIGAKIDLLDDIPVIDGGIFGIDSGMPYFEGNMESDVHGIYLPLSFGISGGYSKEKRTTSDTRFKKLKKVTVVGYNFELEVEGEFSFYYSYNSESWSMDDFYIYIAGDLTKTWTESYKKLGIGFEAGVGIGGKVSGMLNMVYEDGERKYSGLVGFMPHAFLHVDGEFGVAAVSGDLEARLPANIFFPELFIRVGLNVDLKVTARALLWTKTLYDKRLVNVEWTSEKLNKLMMSPSEMAKEFSGKENSGLELMPREYSGRPSVWLADEDATLFAALRSVDLPEADSAASERNPDIRSLMENIYPEAEPQLVGSGNELWLVWADDNPARDAVNRTQLRYSVQKDGVWQEPIWIDDDGTADFTPAAAAVEDGVLMAWHNISKAITEEEGLDEMLKSSEISVTENALTADGSSPNIIRLTDDDLIDHSPVLASNGSNALLVWIKSEDMGLRMDGEEEKGYESKQGSQLYYSEWSGGTWSEPSPIGDNNATVLSVSLSMEGEQGLLLYTLDMDNNLYTNEDQEVYARVYDGNAWGEAIRLSNNSIMDSMPKAVSVNGQWFITWLQEGQVKYMMGLGSEIKTAGFTQSLQSKYQLVAKSGPEPLVALIFSQPGERKTKGISASFYDVVKDQWGNAVTLVAPEEYSGAMSAEFDDDGKLNVAYTEAKIIVEAVPDDNGDLVERTAKSDKVDLKLLSYTPIHDVALLHEDGMFLSTEFPLPGTVTTVYVTLRNEGDFGENAIVYLYDGNPDAGGRLIGESEAQLIPARSSEEIEIAWLVGPEEKDGNHLYAVARPVGDVQESDDNNNTIDLEFSNADIAITALNCQNIAEDNYMVRATITNSGSKTLEGIAVRLEKAGDAALLQSEIIEHMDPGQKTPLTFMISSEGLEKDENGHVNLLLRVVLPEGVQDDFADDNIRSFSLIPAELLIDMMNIRPGSKQVDPATELRFGFNMNIGEGAGYSDIKLIDVFLNEVAISKRIEDNTLIITPVDMLEHGTDYTIMIPVDAVGDSYGHSLTKGITYSFTTKTSNPEVVFAYPGENMEDAALNTEIRLKYNQAVQRGPYFSEIALYGENSEKVAVSAAINGEYLTLSYSGDLDENTSYTVHVPQGAVQNDVGESQSEDYMLTFMTGEAEDEDDEEGNDDSGDNSGGDNGGNNGADDNNNGQSSSDDQQYQASINIDGAEKAIEVRTEEGKAIVELGEHASEIFAGNQQAVVNIPPIPDVNTYTLEMPAEVLSSSGTSSMTINMPWGSITIPCGMLSNMEEIDGRTASISIVPGDASKLPEDVRAAIGDRPILQLKLALDGVEADWSNPSAPVRVSIPYEPTAAEEESPESIVVWYIDAQGNILVIPNGNYKQSNGAVSFSTTHFSDFAVAFNPVRFKDVSDRAWYNSAVSFIAARGITNGTGKGNFSPSNKLTRGQAITMIMRAYGIAPDTDPADNFSDAGDTWYTGYLAAAKRLGISKGVGNNLFAPEKQITRQEMFTLLYNALRAINQLPSDTDNQERTINDFTDAGQINSWAREAMTLLVETGIVNGNAGKLFPLDTTTRAQMAQVLYNLMTR